MAKKRRKKKKEKRSFYEANKDIIKFIAIFSFVSVISYFIYYYILRNSLLMFSLKNGTAFITASLLSFFGFNASAHNNVISFDGFGMEIIDECTAIFSSIIYISAVVAYPANVKQKFIGAIFGVILLYLIDVLRLIILALVGATNPGIFEYIHVYLWQTTFIAFVIIVFVLWISKVKSYVR